MCLSGSLGHLWGGRQSPRSGSLLALLSRNGQTGIGRASHCTDQRRQWISHHSTRSTSNLGVSSRNQTHHSLQSIQPNGGSLPSRTITGHCQRPPGLSKRLGLGGRNLRTIGIRRRLSLLCRRRWHVLTNHDRQWIQQGIRHDWNEIGLCGRTAPIGKGHYDYPGPTHLLCRFHLPSGRRRCIDTSHRQRIRGQRPDYETKT
mmetsp:Transcript_15580/g.28989  ORF Transcript_15580/g.28989 Transcript_15580/m.28989 type:complete len:202 (+) Transcript_15580:564-1169(+)